MGALEPTAALELSEPLEYGGGSPVTEPEDFKDEEPKENTAGVPPTAGREKVVDAADNDGGTETGAVAAETSSFCGA